MSSGHDHDSTCDDDCDGLYVCDLVGHGYHDDEHPCPGASAADLGMCDPGCHQGSHTSTCVGYDVFTARPGR